MKNLIVIFLLFASVLFAQTIKLTPVDTLYPDSTRGERFVTALASLGDINKDGYDDFAVGYSRAYTHHWTGEYDSRVVIYYGNPEMRFNPGLEINFKSKFGDFFWAAPIIKIENVGDVNGDGWDDILLGMPGWFVYKYGRVFLYYGGNPMDTVLDWTFADTILHWCHEFGTNITGIGDWNSDGYDDFVISGYWDDVECLGQVYFIWGADPPDTDSYILWEGEAWFEKFGIGLAGADLDGDGRKELYIANALFYASGFPSDSFVRLFRQNLVSKDIIFSFKVDSIYDEGFVTLSVAENLYNDSSDVLYYQFLDANGGCIFSSDTFLLIEVKYSEVTHSIELNEIDIATKIGIIGREMPVSTSIVQVTDLTGDGVDEVVSLIRIYTPSTLGVCEPEKYVYTSTKIYIFDPVDDYSVIYQESTEDIWYKPDNLISLDYNNDGQSELIIQRLRLFGGIQIFTFGEYPKVTEKPIVEKSNYYFANYYNNTFHFYSLTDQEAFIEIYDISGRKVISKEIYVRKGNNEIIIENLSQGLFLYKITFKNTDVMYKGNMIIIN